MKEDLHGIDLSALRTFMTDVSRGGGGSWFLQFSGGSLSRLTIFALGLGPYLTACFLIQLISALVPRLRPLLFGGEAGREKTKNTCIFWQSA